MIPAANTSCLWFSFLYPWQFWALLLAYFYFVQISTLYSTTITWHRFSVAYFSRLDSDYKFQWYRIKMSSTLMTSMQQRYHVTGFFWYLKYISTLILLYFYFILNAGFANKLVYLTLLTRRHMTWPNYTDASIFHPHLMGQIIAGMHFTTNSLIFMLQKQSIAYNLHN